mmetsp:Transcript_20074/g.37715  ORF Transcript_20074/g.37715 Transcript_20074/m.37715 type:complete len:112 (+) Transcript_20074:859-1194(+)
MVGREGNVFQTHWLVNMRWEVSSSQQSSFFEVRHHAIEGSETHPYGIGLAKQNGYCSRNRTPHHETSAAKKNHEQNSSSATNIRVEQTAAKKIWRKERKAQGVYNYIRGRS